MTLTGAATGSYACTATVGYYQGQTGVVILTDEPALTFNFSAAVSATDDLEPGTFRANDVVQAATYYRVESSSGGDDPTWAAAAENGADQSGTFALAIDSVGPESQGIFSGTKGSLDATLAPVGPTAQGEIKAHVDFVSIGVGSYSSHDGGDRDGPSDDDAGDADAAVSGPTLNATVALSGGVSSSFPAYAVIEAGDTYYDFVLSQQNAPVTGGYLLQCTVFWDGVTPGTGTFTPTSGNNKGATSLVSTATGARVAYENAGPVTGSSGAVGTYELHLTDVGPEVDAGVPSWFAPHGSFTATLVADDGGAPIDVSASF